MKKRRQETPERILATGEHYFQSLIQDIGQAAYSIDLETYILKNDFIGQSVVEALALAATRGVRVRVLVDGAGTPFLNGNLSKTLEKAGVQTRVFHPFPWHLWNWSRSVVRLPGIVKWIYLLLKINSRNHRKVCIVDHQIAYVGSFNVAADHLKRENGGNNWRDTAIRWQGAGIKDLQKAFDAVWEHRPIKDRIREIFREVNKNPRVRLNHTWLRRRILYKNLLRRINRCQKRIWITNAYFVPDAILMKKLQDAARRGIDVRILLPQKSDIMIMPLASSTFYSRLLHAGVRIFEYLPKILHSKTLMIDDWMLVGSSNLNHRSLLHDFEVDVSVQDPDSKKSLEANFLQDLQSAREISLKHWEHHRSFLQRFLGQLTLFAKYWI